MTNSNQAVSSLVVFHVYFCGNWETSVKKCHFLQSKVYRGVIEDVIKNVRESFLNEGVDEQVLQELKQVTVSLISQG